MREVLHDHYWPRHAAKLHETVSWPVLWFRAAS
jgi:hypothetical protein